MKYSLTVNGKEIPVNEVRTSKQCFNRIFSGKQRDLSQTEISYFATIDGVFPLTCTVKVSEKVNSYEIRPLTKNIKSVLKENLITFTVGSPCQLSLEVNGYLGALALFFNETDIPQKSADYYFEKGVHDIGLLFLHDNQSVYIEEGAVVHGAIYIKDAKNVKISGRGILDGSFIPRPQEENAISNPVIKTLTETGLTDTSTTHEEFFGVLTAYNSSNISVEGITVTDPFLWCVILRNGCENVEINNIKIIGAWRYNADGIDICSSDNVTVKNCFIRSFDDCIVVRGPYMNMENNGCKNIRVENNTLWCDWGKNLEVWNGPKISTIEGVEFKNNYLIRIANVAISIDTWYGSSCSSVKNIKYENIFAETDAYPLAPLYQKNETDKYEHKLSCEPAVFIFIFSSKLGKMTSAQLVNETDDLSDINVYYENISFTNVRQIGPRRNESLIGSPKYKINMKGITFNNCDL